MASSLFDFHDKVFLITGAASGIGAAISRELVTCGARLALADRDDATLEALAGSLGLAPQRLSISGLQVQQRDSCHAAVEQALQAHGRIDVLINSAGVNTRMRPEDYPEAVWDDIVDINLKGTFNMCQAVYPAMKDQGGGRILNIGSILSLMCNGMTAPYAASKGGVLQLSRALACAWAEHNILVNAILPGWIDTPLSRRARDDIPGHAERVVETTPLRRWGTPQDVVGAALFLSSPAADFITATSLVVDGGVTAQV